MAKQAGKAGKEQPVMRLESVTKSYNLGLTRVDALRGVSLEVFDSENVAIMGASGSGKSTMMHILGCLDTPTTGKYFLKGTDVTSLTSDELAHLRGKTIGFVFQFFYLIPSLSAIDNVILPLVFNGYSVDERMERGEKLLKTVGLGRRMGHKPSELSGGERQRVAIARALSQNPSILLADEPTGNLDSKSGKEIMDLFEELHSKRDIIRTLVMVTHDPGIAKHAERIVHFKDGLIVKDEEVKR
jgi:putative ABC transport system ATP-binding protein